jgi:preprotein translocase subunit SecY
LAVLERLITSLQNILKIPELRSRVLFTLAMLAVYRMGAHIPTPGINNEELFNFLQQQGGALLGFLDIFSGGALSRLTIFALGIMPYISASIILQLLTVVVPHLSKLAKEGERGRKTIYQVGQISLPFLIILAVVMLGVVTAIVFLESGRRKVAVQYAKRVVGRRVYGGQSTHIPLKINTAGVIPPIFASSIIAFPATITGFIQIPWVQSIGAQLAPGSVLYTLMYVSMIIFFCFFYTAVVLNPVDMADNMKKYGGFIPGIRPGQKTADYIYRVLTRITFAGAIYLAIVCVIPELLIYKLNMPFYFGGTSLLIVIGVGLDTAQQIESHMLMRNYEGFLTKGRLKGRSG